MRTPPLFVCLLLAGCVAPEASGPNEEEPIASTQMELRSIDPAAATWIEEHIPVWDIYLGGRGHDLHPGKDPWNAFTNVYYDDPPDSDVFAPIILVKKGDGDRPERWIQLSLTRHWQMGQSYFDELTECHDLTPLDFVVILNELGKVADRYVEPRPIYTLKAATRDVLRDLRRRSGKSCQSSRTERFHAFAGMEDGPYGPPLPPAWVDGPDTHTYGPGPMGPVGGSGQPLPSNFVPDSDRVSQTQLPPRPAPPRAPEHNGVLRGDPKPKPAPTDQGYRPRPGERREVFKCDGEVFYGYKAGCLDLSNRSASMKWMVQGADWLVGKYEWFEGWRTRFQNEIVKGRDQDECETNCQYLGLAEGVVVGVIVPGVCFVATKSLFCGEEALVQLAAMATGAAPIGVSTIKTTSECVRHICKGK